MWIWIFLTLISIFMEIVYHIGCYGMTGVSPLLPVAVIILTVSVEYLFVCLTKGKIQKIIFWSCIIGQYLLFAVQTVYYTIFRQPLQIQAIFEGGQNAITSYWKETGVGIMKSMPLLLLYLLPILIFLLLLVRKKFQFKEFNVLQKTRAFFVVGLSVLGFYVILNVGKYLDENIYEEYTEYYAPLSISESMGLITMVQRECLFAIESLGGADVAASMDVEKDDLPEIVTPIPYIVPTSTPESIPAQQEKDSLPSPSPTPMIVPNVLELDMEKLNELSKGEKQKEWLAKYINTQIPTMTNQYTGIFEGYNLIYITAEGFSTYAVHPELTPTLYKLVNSGFVFENYYVPLWQTSTSDGEYVNCTGLIPDGQFSMRKSGQNNMAFSLPKFFEKEGVKSYAYHNNTMSYYERHITHPNLGYDFRASKLGNCSQEEYGEKIFPMENPGKWPASDYEMMQGSVPEYINEERFHVYYMTISGHMYYSFSGNSMSSKNKEAVKDMDMSENARAYYACHIELDKALEYLIEQLDAAGKLQNTVICVSADHYPYAMTKEEYEELAGKDLSQDMDMYRNSLILWNAGIEEPILVKKACCSVDILPTLLNLFGFSFDSRMYAGRDIFSEEEGVVIFNNRSFVTDTVFYDKKGKTQTWKFELSEEQKEAYMEYMKEEVKRRYSFSAYILQENYYQLIMDCLINP